MTEQHFIDRNGNYFVAIEAIETPEGAKEVSPRPAAHWLWQNGAWAEGALPLPPVPQELSFAQFLIGLAELGWITDAEADAWLAGNALPAGVVAVLDQLPESADGQKPRLRAKARALRPSVIERNNELLLMMAQARGATAEQLDAMFRAYAAT